MSMKETGQNAELYCTGLERQVPDASIVSLLLYSGRTSPDRAQSLLARNAPQNESAVEPTSGILLLGEPLRNAVQAVVADADGRRHLVACSAAKHANWAARAVSDRQRVRQNPGTSLRNVVGVRVGLTVGA